MSKKADMHTKTTSFSFEIFPPKTDAGLEKLWTAMERLAELHPEFVSVTCGAGGSAIDGTTSVVHHIRTTYGIEAVPHVAIARQSRRRLRDVLQEYKNKGVKRIVAVRGDASLSTEEGPGDDVYPNTVDFVAELRLKFGLDPIVAAYPDVHPLALSPQQDMDHLKRKVDAGAVLAISQFFFLPETFLRFRDKMHAAGIDIPLAAGIMPIQNLAQVVKFADGCGALVPDGFTNRFHRHNNNEAAQFQEGVAHAVELCDHLRRNGVDHFHIYALNRCEMTLAVLDQLAGTTGPSPGIAAVKHEQRLPIQ